jgi:ABC-2 type transport system ATP-binding protein
MDLIKPTKGSATVLGRPIGDVETKRRIGFLPDAPAFSPYLKAYEFLTICAKLLKIPSNERKNRIDEVLNAVRMSEHAKSKLGGFSRGMIQRIGIAQAILNKPELLILDEPLVGLDPHGRQELKDIIAEQKKAGTNVFFCSHILSDVERMCDYIGVLSQGKLLCSGKLADLLSETGARVIVKSEYEDIAKDLMTDSSSSRKIPDEGWELIFEDNRKVYQKLKDLKEKYPGAMTITPSRENLENFFFRLIEKNRKAE